MNIFLLYLLGGGAPGLFVQPLTLLLFPMMLILFNFASNISLELQKIKKGQIEQHWKLSEQYKKKLKRKLYFYLFSSLLCFLYCFDKILVFFGRTVIQYLTR